MRNPKDVLIGRIEAAANRRVYDKKVAARRKVEDAARGALKKGQTKVEGKKKGGGGWWPFGKKGGASGGAPTCPGCDKEVDPTWTVCPYCGASFSEAHPGPVTPAGLAPLPVGDAEIAPMVPVNKTMAINLDDLAAPKRRVVGWIVVMVGHQKGTDFRLFEGNNCIGAAADNDIVITDEYLSSKHASIRFEDNRYDFIDHDSTNHSYLNEKQVSKEELIDNDSIRLGRTEFRFKALY